MILVINDFVIDDNDCDVLIALLIRMILYLILNIIIIALSSCLVIMIYSDDHVVDKSDCNDFHMFCFLSFLFLMTITSLISDCDL